ncbi:MAG: glucose-6-phosphate dehydrogenase [Geminicoccaceae bacterium]|nr:glucose-6-phosphate dehydrogenase [Geminicoccaceae bacterium]
MSARFIPVDPFDLIVFGGTGDLAMRKLLPGLYHRDHDNQLPPESRIIGVSRSETGRKAYAEAVEAAIREHIPESQIDEDTLNRFLRRLDHVALDAAGAAGWKKLVATIGRNGRTNEVRVFYLATAPRLFGPIARNLEAHDLITPKSRVVLEKPIGRNLATARAINDEVGAVFAEEQIFRIDHYLGKETVQNLIALRFANMLFEPLWNSTYIDHVQITVAESLGVEGRADYYDTSGALRDMVQNHILQLLCLVAMETPRSLEADAVRDEKLKVLRSLARIGDEDAEHKTVRGQYRAGAVDGKAVPGYRDELSSREPSTTETFAMIKAEVKNWRWAGVPFYLRTGKRMAARQSEIIIQFREVPHSIFGGATRQMVPNRLEVRLQPDEAIRLFLMTKDPGPGGMRLHNEPLNLAYADIVDVHYPDAYERLLMEVVRGNATLFMRKDEVEAAWEWVEPILEAWERSGDAPKPYNAGSWGPSAAVALIEKDGRNWHEDAF